MTYSIFQSTFPRGERPFYAYTVNSIRRISIHVPAWGTTIYTRYSADFRRISIHVPAWGTTCECSYAYSCYTNFNPRSRVGNDPNWCRGDYIPISISIHVPAWGTTQSLLQAKEISKISIHVPAWGTTRAGCKRPCVNEISIHVPAWGTTLYSIVFGLLRVHFNPRSRVGNDKL